MRQGLYYSIVEEVFSRFPGYARTLGSLPGAKPRIPKEVLSRERSRIPLTE